VRAFPFESRGVAVNCTVCPAITLGEAGLTLTDATATGVSVTVIPAVPFLPSLVAVMIAGPAVIPVTRPPLLTVATPVLLLAHVTTRPVSAFPVASRGVAVSCTVCPTGTLASVGLMVTDATGTGVTDTAAVPLLPSLVAVIVAEPVATPVTSPLALTVATAALLLPHVTTRPDSVLPLASRGVAVSWIACPTLTLDDAGITPTVATGRSRMRTRDEPESCAALVADTRKSPAAVPAANIPSDAMLPPVALQVTVTAELSPVAVRP
jgi:hypothetical protein